MAKKDTRREIVNPAAGRKVLMTGETGKRIRELKRQKDARKRSPKKHAKKSQKSTAPKMTCIGGKCKKAISYGFPGATARPSPPFKIAGKTKGYAKRPSARACFDAGACGPVVYGGKVHVMAIDALGRPSWKAIC